LITPKSKNKKQAQNAGEKANAELNEHKQDENLDESDSFPNYNFDYDAIIKFELLSVAIPKSKEEALALKQTLKERKVEFVDFLFVCLFFNHVVDD
jgi:hypothetical protein